MPRRSTALSPQGTAESAYRAVQSDARVMILRFLLEAGTADRRQITEATGLSNSTALGAIAELVDAGYVVTNIEANAPRAGRRVDYTADRRKLTADLFDFMGWLLS